MEVEGACPTPPQGSDDAGLTLAYTPEAREEHHTTDERCRAPVAFRPQTRSERRDRRRFSAPVTRTRAPELPLASTTLSIAVVSTTD